MKTRCKLQTFLLHLRQIWLYTNLCFWQSSTFHSCEKDFSSSIYPDYSAKPLNQLVLICFTVNHLDMVLPVWLRIQTNERAGRYRKGNSCDGSGPNARVQICKVIIYKLYLSSETWKKTHAGFHHLPDHIHTPRTTLHTSWILPMQPVFYIWLDLLYHHCMDHFYSQATFTTLNTTTI